MHGANRAVILAIGLGIDGRLDGGDFGKSPIQLTLDGNGVAVRPPDPSSRTSPQTGRSAVAWGNTCRIGASTVAPTQ
jgi:hypothetical protein